MAAVIGQRLPSFPLQDLSRVYLYAEKLLLAPGATASLAAFVPFLLFLLGRLFGRDGIFHELFLLA
jgi:membrane-bound metal-dependent hydrolase YbcI (DUF457 family)